MIESWFSAFRDRLIEVFLSPASQLSLFSLLAALLLGVGFLLGRRGLTRQTRMRAVWRALFGRGFWRHPSFRLDVLYTLCNVFLFGGFVAVAVLAQDRVGRVVAQRLEGMFGPSAPVSFSEGICVAIVTFVMYLAYELGYWVDHYLSHRVPILWEFHKVHHAATRLTPLTNWRMHLVDSLLFLNILALLIGTAHAVTNYALGQDIHPSLVAHQNVVFLLYFYLYGHLQHTHLWIPFTGWAGKLFSSPAHHQIHHSNHPRHYNKNFGGGLALWDWVFGTLHMPTKKREALTFGVMNDGHLQRFLPSMFVPFLLAARHLKALRFVWPASPMAWKVSAQPVPLAIPVEAPATAASYSAADAAVSRPLR